MVINSMPDFQDWSVCVAATGHIITVESRWYDHGRHNFRLIRIRHIPPAEVLWMGLTWAVKNAFWSCNGWYESASASLRKTALTQCNSSISKQIIPQFAVKIALWSCRVFEALKRIVMLPLPYLFSSQIGHGKTNANFLKHITVCTSAIVKR